MRIQVTKTISVATLFLTFLFINFLCLHACQIETDIETQFHKESVFNFNAKEGIRGLLKQQVKLKDFNDKTKIRPIQLTFDISQLSTMSNGRLLSQNQIQYLKSILEEIQEYFKRFIKVTPYPGNIIYEGGSYCYDHFVPLQDRTVGIPNSDLHLYIADANDYRFLAAAIHCQVGKQVGFIRPNFGSIGLGQVFFPRNYDDPNIRKRNLDTIIHETLHVLGFSIMLYPYFLDINQIHLERIHNVDNFYIASPRVQEAARKYYNCSTLCGMKLENQGGSGSQNSHWETTTLFGEIMNPQSSPNYQALSIFTIKLLQDTGFYSEVNENFANQIFWGKNKGCEFMKNACKSQQRFPEFPDNSRKSQCDFENEGQSRISIHDYGDNDCQFRVLYSNTRCNSNSNVNSQFSQITLESFTYNSKCFSSNILNSNSGYDSFSDDIRCLEFQCIQRNKEIKIFIDTKEQTNFSVVCRKEDAGKQLLINSGVVKTKTITCPNDYEQFCSKKYCPNNCSEKGFCLNGKCLCQPGHAKSDCSLSCGLNSYAKFKKNNGTQTHFCVKKCPKGKYVNPDNTCRRSCFKGYYKGKKKCKPCDSSCSKCKGPRRDQCTACHFVYTLKNNTCV